jgi:hypothetical protein
MRPSFMAILRDNPDQSAAYVRCLARVYHIQLRDNKYALWATLEESKGVVSGCAEVSTNDPLRSAQKPMAR